MATPKTRLVSGDNLLSIDYTTSGAKVAGDVVVINGVATFVEKDIAASGNGSLYFSGGVWAGQKITGAMTLFAPLYWNSTGDPVTGTAGTGAYTTTYAAGLQFVGFVVKAALSADDEVQFVKVNGSALGLQMRSGQATTASATDTIVTGLSFVVGAVATFDADPSDGNFLVSATTGDQAGTPAAGSFILKTWKNTSGSDPTPVAASSFSQKVNWIAFGY